MTRLESNIKPRNNRMNKIIPDRPQLKLTRKLEIINCAGIQIEIEDFIGIGYEGFEFDGIDERFAEGDGGDG